MTLPSLLGDVVHLMSGASLSYVHLFQLIVAMAMTGNSVKARRDEPNMWTTSDWLTVNTQKQEFSTGNKPTASGSASPVISDNPRQSTRKANGITAASESIHTSMVQAGAHFRIFIIDGQRSGTASRTVPTQAKRDLSRTRDEIRPEIRCLLFRRVSSSQCDNQPYRLPTHERKL